MQRPDRSLSLQYLLYSLSLRSLLLVYIVRLSLVGVVRST